MTVPDRIRLTHTITCGWVHDIVDDPTEGPVAVIRRDDDGQPVPRTYTVPTRYSLGDVNRAVARMLALAEVLPDELTDAEVNWALLTEFVGQLVGAEVITSILDDPTATVEDKYVAIAAVIDAADLTHLLPGDVISGGPPPGE